MATRYVRQYSLKDSLTDEQVAEFWKTSLNEVLPVVGKVKGVQSVRIFSGAGALRADLTVVIDMDDASVYEAMLRDPGVIKVIGAFYGAIDLKTSTQRFIREVTPDLLKALSS